MKKSYKKINTLGQILMLVLVFLCGINVTYAYFTAQAKAEGELTFYNLNINFYYKKTGASDSTQTNKTEFEIIPNSNEGVLRGKEFKFKVDEGGTLVDLDQISLGSSTDSCPAFIRVKVIARKVNPLGENDWSYDTTDQTDYGNYIDLTYSTANITKVTKQNTNYYFFKNKITTNEILSLATGATISTSAPVELTKCNLKITIVFEAVQANYDAAVATFGEDGVLTNWKSQN